MIPIPRTGCYWGVEDKLPPDTSKWETGYNIVIVKDIYHGDTYDEISFETKNQALISIWLMGYSYAQMLKLFPEFENIQNLRNYIFPRCLGTCIELRVSLNWCPPRQLVDSEYIAIVGEVGVPKGKINKATYKRYMDWVQHREQVWWINSNKSKVGLDRLIEKHDKLRCLIQKKEEELNDIVSQINSLSGIEENEA